MHMHVHHPLRGFHRFSLKETIAADGEPIFPMTGGRGPACISAEPSAATQTLRSFPETQRRRRSSQLPDVELLQLPRAC